MTPRTTLPLLYFPNPVETEFSYPDPDALEQPNPTLSRAARKATFALLTPRAVSPLSFPDSPPDSSPTIPPPETAS